MAASMSNHVRVKLSFNLIDTQLENDEVKKFHGTGMLPTWYLIDVSSTDSVSSLEQDIIRRFRLPSNVSLFLDGCVVPSKESIHIFRDNDAVTVRCRGHRDTSCHENSPTVEPFLSDPELWQNVTPDTCLDSAEQHSHHSKKKKKKKKLTVELETMLSSIETIPLSPERKKKKKKKRSASEYLSDDDHEVVKKKKKKRKREQRESDESSEEQPSKPKKTKWDVTADDLGKSKEMDFVHESPDSESQRKVKKKIHKLIEVRDTSMVDDLIDSTGSNDAGSKSADNCTDLTDALSSTAENAQDKRKRRRKRCRTRKKRTQQLDVDMKVGNPPQVAGQQTRQVDKHSSITAEPAFIRPRGRAFGATMIGMEKHIRFNSDGEQEGEKVSKPAPAVNTDQLDRCDAIPSVDTSNLNQNVSSNNTPSIATNQTEHSSREVDQRSPGHTISQLLSIAGCSPNPPPQPTGKNMKPPPVTQLVGQAPVFTRNRKKYKRNSNYALTKDEQLQSLQTNTSVIIQNTSLDSTPNSTVTSNGDAVADGTMERQNGMATPADDGVTEHSSVSEGQPRSEESQKPAEAEKKVVPAVDYSAYPNLDGAPRVGDRIAYKVLEMLEDYSPGVSQYKAAVVLHYCPLNKTVELQVDTTNTGKKVPGRFDVHVEDEEEVLTNTGAEEENVTLHLSSLLETKLIS